MKLAFNSSYSGLGNNGGTRTIIKCCEALRKLAHDCDIIAAVDKFTWFEHRPPIRYISKDLDAVIAVACTDVYSTLKILAPVKAWYIRGHENWTMSDQKLRELYNSDVLNIVNSRGLQQLLAAYGADSKVVYQGIDFDLWKDKGLRSNDKIRIGAIYDEKSTKRWTDFAKLAQILGHKDYEYVAAGSKMPKEDFLSWFRLNANVSQLNELYSSCHIWFAPTELEGLHNPPMEAALCGCLIVCSDAPMNGMGFDYAFDGNTAMVYRAGDVDHAAELIKNPNWDCIERMDNCLRHDIGTRENNMRKLVKYLEK